MVGHARLGDVKVGPTGLREGPCMFLSLCHYLFSYFFISNKITKIEVPFLYNI